jgi:hypothetical protein
MSAAGTPPGALYDKLTRWPAGFDPDRHGAVLAR